ncbi:MAG: hypothetical protein WC889_12520, partial [Myxococcota bacterium]
SKAPDSVLAESAASDASRAEEHLFRDRMSDGALVLVLSSLLFLVAALARRGMGARELLRPLPETIVLAAGSVILLAILFRLHRDATAWFAVMFTLYVLGAQMSGVLLRRTDFGFRLRLAYLAAAVALSAAAFYAAIVKAGLFGALKHTIQFGPG